MRLYEFLQYLYEKNPEQYAQMISPLRKVDENAFNMAQEGLKWAMNTFPQPSGIIWYLRWLKLGLLVQELEKARGAIRTVTRSNQNMNGDDASNHIDTSQADQTAQMLEQMINKELMKFKQNGVDPQTAEVGSQHVLKNQFNITMEHYFSMRLPKITNYRFRWETPTEVQMEMNQIEEEWRENLEDGAGALELDEDAEIVLQFEDGSAWINLNRPACSEEADAMGHCGNAGGYDEETILSFRTKAEDPETGRTFWSPKLTFILNKETGKLGEMKGRGNDKPAKRYHPYIIALLKLPIIKGIRGGGYMPENNFALSDLDQEAQNALVKEKPKLANMQWRVKNDFNQEVIDEIIRETDAEEYLEDENAFVIRYIEDLSDLPNEVNSSSRREDILSPSLIDGEAFFDVGMEYGPEDLIIELMEDVLRKKPEWKEPFFRYVATLYTEEFADKLGYDSDEIDESDIEGMVEDAMGSRYAIGEAVQTLRAEYDDLYDHLRHGVADGIRLGAEQEFRESLQAWMAEPVTSDSAPVRFIELDGGKEVKIMKAVLNPENGIRTYKKVDTTAYLALVAPPITMAEFYDGALYEIDGGDEAEDIDAAIEYARLEEPRYGWQGYDEDGAVEAFLELDGGDEMQNIVDRYGKSGGSDNEDS